ncbi:hypothetical protein [Pedobacter cryoconitis]|uniref:Lipoprotein n=1 Tax=Pedobacter cryoconitis TaxID=188932 RepID=A0A327S482_9SPHI|nr:hypothetical protein [Pedobacter cryoconitis]RAJ22393.1 hypothetical protein LY11_04858 [Pedobacter cryoconitis]
MKTTKIYSCLVISLIAIALLSGCRKDPYNGVTSNERSIEAFTLASGQIGPAIIDRTAGVVKINVLIQQGTDLTKIIPTVQSSYKAQLSPASGEAVSFATNNETTYKVTAESGETREWKVQLIPFVETLLGTYDVKGLMVYGGTGVEYGGGGVIGLQTKPVWPAAGPAAELDNVLTFTYSGSTADGKTYGTITNDAGADGLYANFLFTSTPQTDVNNFYRKIPKGNGKWSRDYTANTVTFTFADETTTVGTFAGAGTESLGNGLTKTIADQAFVFTLNGVDNYGAIYSDYDKIVSHPRKYWIDVKKRN